MAKVAIVFKVYPEEGAIEQASANIKAMGAKAIQKDEIGFGITVLKVLFTFDDTQTSSSKLEEQLKAQKGVSEVEVQEESLI